MFPIHLKLTVSNPEELARITAFVASDFAGLVASKPTITEPAEPTAAPTPEQVPGKASAAKTARSKPTAEAAPSPSAPTADAPATSTEDTPPAAAATSAPAPAEITYADLRAAVIALHKVDPRATEAIAKGMGKNTFKDMIDEPALWPVALGKVQAKSAELAKG